MFFTGIIIEDLFFNLQVRAGSVVGIRWAEKKTGFELVLIRPMCNQNFIFLNADPEPKYDSILTMHQNFFRLQSCCFSIL